MMLFLSGFGVGVLLTLLFVGLALNYFNDHVGPRF